MKFFKNFLILAIVLDAWASARPMDIVDECLFTCDYCFKGEVLLKCANQCLLTADNMILPWATICPYFGSMEFYKR